jgi:hypothetical protein
MRKQQIMKRLFLIPVLALMCSTVYATDVVFTWSKPTPKFTSALPPTYDIDEYHIYCNVDEGGPAAAIYEQTALGYDTETITATGIPDGQMTCIMRSYSLLLDRESADSDAITKHIVGGTVPGKPIRFNFSE